MIFFRVRELLAEKERREGRRIPLKEIHEATGIKPQVLSNLTSPTRQAVTNTAFIDALTHYFGCSFADLMVQDPPVGEAASPHVDELYPNRRQQREEE